LLNSGHVRRLIEPAMLDVEELAWLNAYHARVRAELSPLLDTASRAWLEAATEPCSPSS
jgi:Xaa-Pro aminopeptidase